MFRIHGTIKWFDEEKGTGFITPNPQGDTIQNDIFFHFTGIMEQNAPLTAGQSVTFVVKQGQRGPSAGEIIVG